MKKLIATLFVFVLAVSMVGCGKEATQESYNEKASKELLRAAKSGSVQDVKSALKEGANPSYLDKGMYYTPLFLAIAVSKNEEVVKELLNAGAKVNMGEDWGKEGAQNPLIFTAINIGNANIVKMLVDAGADLGSKDLGGQTVKQAAEKTGNIDIINLVSKK